LPSGTGTTSFYLNKHLQPFDNIKVYTVPVATSKIDLTKEFNHLAGLESLTKTDFIDRNAFPEILDSKTSYKFTKPYTEFKKIWCMLQQRGVEFDLIYSPKTWKVLFENWNLFKEHEIIYVHTGSLTCNTCFVNTVF